MTSTTRELARELFSGVIWACVAIKIQCAIDPIFAKKAFMGAITSLGLLTCVCIGQLMNRDGRWLQLGGLLGWGISLSYCALIGIF
jgi:hypothetical protein